MKFLWCDTETTGLETRNAAPFQIAFIYVNNHINGKIEKEEVFYLNPFDINGIEYSEDAGKINGYSREQIEKFEPSKKVVEKMNDFLSTCFNDVEVEEMYFCGYNADFDFNHLEQLFSKNGFNFTQYFHTQILDVFNQVKEAGKNKVLPYLKNRKLVTIAKYLKIDLSNAHDALSDIKATRQVAKSLAMCGIPLK